MTKPDVIHVFSVRDRPVGFQPSRWGGALVAIERGFFPVSSTGYRSLSTGLETGKEMISASFLEALAGEQDRERQSLLKRLREAVKPVGGPINCYIHVSLAYEKAVQAGLFAPDRDRAALWAGAHQLLCLVDTDKRFQPAPNPAYPAWTKKHCAASLAKARVLHELLPRFAAGDFSKKLPVHLLGAKAYFELPPKPGDEPKIDLGGFTAEMALNLPALPPAPHRTPRAPCAGPAGQPASAEIQLGLFEAVTAGLAAAAPPTPPVPRTARRQGTAPRL